MARPITGRTVDVRSAVVERIEWELAQREWSIREMDRQMDELGCKTDTYKILRDGRKIDVDELVTMAKLFEVPVDDLLIPIELLNSKRVQKIVKESAEAEEVIYDLVRKLADSTISLIGLFDKDGEFEEFAINLHERELAERELDAKWNSYFESVKARLGDGASELDRATVESAARKLHLATMEALTWRWRIAIAVNSPDVYRKLRKQEEIDDLREALEDIRGTSQMKGESDGK